MTLLLAQSKVVDVVVPGATAAPATAAAGWSWAAAGLVVVVLGVALLWARWRARRYDAAESAFVKLSKAAGLSGADRRSIRRAAREMGGVQPVGVLFDDAVVRDAIESGGQSHSGVGRASGTGSRTARRERRWGH